MPNIYLGEYEPNEELAALYGRELYYTLPVDSEGNPARGIDLSAPLADPSRKFGLFACAGTLGSDYKLLGTSLADAVPARWQAVLGYSPAAASIGGALIEHFTARSDVAGETGARPPMPLVDRLGRTAAIEIAFAGVRVLRRSFAASGGTTAQQADRLRVVAMLRTQFRALRAASLDRGDRLYLKALGAWGLELSIDRPQDFFIDDDLPSEVPDAPASRWVDDFNRANGGLGALWSFVGGTHSGTGVVASNKLKVGLTTGSSNYADWQYANPVSSANHAAQIDITDASQAGGSFFTRWGQISVFARFADISNNYNAQYNQWSPGNQRPKITKIVAGVATDIYDAGVVSSGPPYAGTSALKLFCNGSTIGMSGPSSTSLTDTSLAGGLYGGMQLLDALTTGDALNGDNFIFDDGLGVVVTRRPMLAGGFQTFGMR